MEEDEPLWATRLTVPFFQFLPPNCTAPFMDVHTWTIHGLQLSFSTLSLVLNIVVALLCHRAAPIPYPQRRQLAWISINYALLAAVQLSRNVFLIISMHRPCMQITNTATCKLQEFPLFFCYIHGGVLVCILASQVNKKFKEVRRPIPYAWMCSIWQTLMAVLCIGITMIFTAFDREDGPAPTMTQCSALLALRQSEKVFWFLTMLICLHGAAAVGVALAVDRKTHVYDRRTVLAFSLRDVVTLETLMWQISLLFSGMAVLYRYVIMTPCEECVRMTLEISFICMPLLCSFFHPILLVWFVYPVRDATVRVFRWMSAIVPEYALVPPPPAKRRHRQTRRPTKFQQEESVKMVNANGRLQNKEASR